MADQPSVHQQLVAEYEIPEAVLTDAAAEHPNAAPLPARGPDGKFQKPADQPPTTETVTPPASPPAAPKHSPFTTRLALDAGISQAEIDGYTPEVLEAVVRREYQAARGERDRARAESRDPAPQPNGVPAEFTEDRPAAPKVEKVEAFTLGEIKDDEFDPRLVKALKQVEKLTAKLEALEADTGGIKGILQQQAALTVQQQIDQFFNAKADRYGAGTRADLKDDSPDLARRMALVQLAQRIQRKGEPVAATLARADSIIYGSVPTAPKPPTEPEPPAPTQRQQEWAEGGVARPTQQLPPEEPKGKRRAVATVAAALREQRSDSGADEYRDLPD